MSNLLEKASIITTPTAYEDGKLLSVKPNTTVGDFDFTRGSSATRVNAQGLIEDVTGTNTPRINYLGGTGSLLLEPASTNRTLNSEQPSTWHSSNGMTVTADATTSPDGTSNASLVVINATSGAIYSRNLFSFTTGTGTQTVTGSYFVKYYNNQWIRIRSNFFSGSPANGKSSFFDIQNGVIGTVNATHTAKIEDYGSGWYRCSITFDIDKDSDTSGYLQLEAMSSDSTNTYPSIGQGYYAFGSQGEELSFPTSYIPTTSSYGSRNADLCNNAGSSDLINSTEGVLYAEVSALANDNTFRLISLSDGTNDNRVYLGFKNSDNTITANVTNAGVSQSQIDYTTTSSLLFNKVAVKYKNNDVSLYVNGIKVGIDTSVTIPSSLNSLQFTSSALSSIFYGKAKCVAVFKEALTDTELTCLTTI